MSGKSQLYKTAEQWRRANPWVLVNTAIVGQACGRFRTEREAIHAAAQAGQIVQIDQAGKRVLFRGPVYL